MLALVAPADFAAQNVAGKIVLINGLATPTAVYAAEQAGAVGQIFINDDHLHYMIVSTIWGTPTPESAPAHPDHARPSPWWKRTVTICARLHDGPLRRAARHQQSSWHGKRRPSSSASWTGRARTASSCSAAIWTPGRLAPWTTAAPMPPCWRWAACWPSSKEQLYRGLRLIFWSGHSHGRYSGSTWYVDNHWEELYDRCVAHVNVDSTGARGATFYGSFPANLELGPFGAEIVTAHTGQASRRPAHEPRRRHELQRRRHPGALHEPEPGAFRAKRTPTTSPWPLASSSAAKCPGGGTPAMTPWTRSIRTCCALDTQIYVSTLWRLCHAPLLPMDFRPVAADIQRTLAELAEAAGPHLDLSRARARAAELVARHRCAGGTPGYDRSGGRRPNACAQPALHDALATPDPGHLHAGRTLRP